ncbi:heterokaryon incompatibility protein-domain-containing protein [Phaeosphaeria sp. MPI-PUGE-AT-0046c]|nr:heterokaryon incompatibility protein-domain-containing protein [Phaeosphaeria sp. MPI-PUGE-AT-0046c]
MIEERSSRLHRSDVGSSASRALFRHDTLDRNTDSFRLIQVLPDCSDEGLIQLSLWQDSISRATYQCLSYRWGDAARHQAVLINGKKFYVGENLFGFLQEVHNNDLGVNCGTALWVDSLCINQSSMQERGHQVQNMGQIYSKAQQVLIWLGGRHTQAPALCAWVRSQSRDGCPASLSGHWEQVRRDPYWCRAWIVQEVLLAKHVSVIFPGASIEYGLLGPAIAGSTDLSRLDEDSAAQLWSFWNDHWSKPRDRAQAHSTVHWLRHERDRNRFWELIHLQKTSKCADKRDRIYSLLGLVCDDLDFPVDYDEDAVDLFWRAGEHFNAWEAPELVDILGIALLNSTTSHDDTKRMTGESMDPRELIESLSTRPDLRLRISVRRATSTASSFCQGMEKVRCESRDCRRAPPLECTQYNILLCTNARSNGPTEHGCIHALATPLDEPPREGFWIRLEAHHGTKTARAELPATALQILDTDTNVWNSIETWKSLGKVLDKKDLDRADRVKLLIPAKYAIWIWYGVHLDSLDQVEVKQYRDLPSAQYILPVDRVCIRESL